MMKSAIYCTNLWRMWRLWMSTWCFCSKSVIFFCQSIDFRLQGTRLLNRFYHLQNSTLNLWWRYSGDVFAYACSCCRHRRTRPFWRLAFLFFFWYCRIYRNEQFFLSHHELNVAMKQFPLGLCDLDFEYPFPFCTQQQELDFWSHPIPFADSPIVRSIFYIQLTCYWNEVEFFHVVQWFSIKYSKSQLTFLL